MVELPFRRSFDMVPHGKERRLSPRQIEPCNPDISIVVVVASRVDITGAIFPSDVRRPLAFIHYRYPSVR